MLPYVKGFVSEVCEDWPGVKGFISCHYSGRVPATTRDFRRAFGFAFSGGGGGDAASGENKNKEGATGAGGILQSLGLGSLFAGVAGAATGAGEAKDNTDPLADVPVEDLATLNSVNDFVVKYGLADEE